MLKFLSSGAKSGRRAGAGLLMALMAALLWPSASQAQTDCLTPPPGLVAWWPGDGDALDVVGGTNTGSFHNGASFAQGLAGLAFDLNGTNNHVVVPYKPSSALFNLTTQFTYEMWVNPLKGGPLVGREQCDNAWPSAELKLWQDRTNSPLVLVLRLNYQNNNSMTDFVSPAVVTTGVWHHVAATYDRGAAKVCLYVDGTNVLESTYSQTIWRPTTPLWIGGIPKSSSSCWEDYFQGLIDELTVYNRALTSNEIATIWLTASLGKCQPCYGRVLQVAPATEVAGREVLLPLRLVGQGNENALSFSLNFDPGLLIYKGESLGPGAAGALLNRNTNQLAAGRIAYGLARPAGQRFAAGTNELLRLRFQLGSTVGTTAVAFADAPVLRETVDDSARVLCTSYSNGIVNITPLFPPTIETPPQSLTIQPITQIATNVSFSITAAGSPPLFYQWLFNGAPVHSATNTSLEVVNVQPSQAGEYRMVVSNDGGAITSAPAVLTLLPAWIPPSISLHPRSQVVSTGETVVLTADGTGFPAPTFQWLFNGSLLSGQTNKTLELTAVTTAQGGYYAMRASNPAGFATSASAGVTVNASLRIVRALTRSVVTSGHADVPVELLGFGDENSVGFSLSFDPTRLRYRGIALGSGASGATLILNTNQLAHGVVGVALTRPAGQSFPTGTSQILLLQFQAGDVSGPSALSFGDQLVTREIADALGNPRPSSFRDGGVDILATAPSLTTQPQGGTVPIFSDTTLQVSAAGSVPLYFQWQHNGTNLPGANAAALTLNNVLPSQAGNYQVLISNLVGAATSSVATLTVPRVVRVVGTNTPSGNPVSVPVHLLSAGDENSLGFSLRFDPARLVFNGVEPNTNLANLTVNVNTNQAAAGVLGLGAARVVPQTWPQGTQEVAILRFTATAQTGTTDIGFADTPAARDLVDANAVSLHAVFQPGTVSVHHVAPTIVQQPQPRDVESGALVAFTVSGTGSLPMTYQWQRNGADLPGATNVNFVIVSAQPSQAGAYSVRLANAGGTIISSNVILTVTPPDTSGPIMTSARYGSASLVDGLVVSNSDTFAVNAIDPSGVRSVEFYVDGAVLLIDDKASDGFAAPWNMDTVAEGPHVIALKAWDWRNNFTAISNLVTVRFFPPPPPSITSPANGTVVADLLAAVSGRGLKNTSVLLYRNGQRVGVPVPVPLNGFWSSPITLVEGINVIQVSAQNQAGEGARSAAVTMVLDTTIPQPPSGVQAAALDAGRIQVTWIGQVESVRGYHVYRSTVSFTNQLQGVRLTSAPLAGSSFIDSPPGDGKYYYRLSTVNTAGTEGGLSTEVWANSDTTPPSALAVQYSPLGSYDPVGRRFGRGVVNVMVWMSEPPQTTPFFSINPAGGQPILVDLRPGVSNQFLGSFVISDSTPSGLATASLSARDAAGNRGTAIQSGAGIVIDTVGPEVADLVMQPARPIRNQSNAPVQVSFVARLTEAVRSNTAPQFAFVLSQTAPAETPVNVSPGIDALTWTGSFVLPASAGKPTELLILRYRGEDELSNISTRIGPISQFEVYQDALPPLESPLALVAKSLPAGAIQLSWPSVPEAADYALFRKGPGDASFTQITRTALALTWTNTPSVDGLYAFAIASVRQANQQESLSPLSNAASAKSDRVAPGAPINLSLIRAANGTFVQWAPPPGLNEPVTYRLYRSDRPITSIGNLAPLITRIPVSQVVDANPTPFQPYYAVAAVDEAGNVSPPSQTEYINAELLPPGSMSIVQSNAEPPVLSWTQSGTSIKGHFLRLGEDATRIQVGGLITNRTYIDTGYAGDERRYTVSTVDNNDQESLGRSLRLPNLSVDLSTNAVVKRGLMNRLTYAVTNPTTNAVENAQLKVLLGGRSHASAGFGLAAQSTTNIPVIVGGYSDLPGTNALVTTTVEIRPHDGEWVSLIRPGQVALGDGQLIVTVMASHVVRGGSAQVQFSLFNPGAEEIEVITARGGGVSPDIRFTLLDVDGHVLSSTPFSASSGAGMVHLPNGDTALRLAGGEEAISTSVALPIPAEAPVKVYVQVEVDHVYYHSDQEDRVVMAGLASRQEFAVVETSYTGAVTSVVPTESRGDQPVTIAGHAAFRGTGQPAPFVPMLVKIANGGFERSEQVLTDASGNFSTTFQPLAGEPGGVYSVWTVHPDLSDRTVQATFVIKRILVAPSNFTVRAPHNFAQSVPLQVTTGPGTSVSNLHAEYRAQDQPGGAFKPGITVGLGSSVPLLGPGQSATLNLAFTGTSEAPRSGQLVLRITSDDAGETEWQKVNVIFEFSESTPSLRWTPTFVDTGVAPSNSVTETVTFENVGLVSATGLRFALEKPDGSPLPSWALLTSPTNLAELAVGGRLDLSLTFNPTNDTPEGNYEFVLRTRAQNHAPVDLGVNVAVITSGRGGAQFRVLDMYSGVEQTDPVSGQKFTLNGVTNALIRLQNELLSNLEFSSGADTNGEVLFTNVPAGHYKFYVTADKHQGYNGRLWIRAGTIAQQQVALTYSLVTVTWEVVPITIQDRYEIVLNATFETDVPAPVVTIDPPGVNLPQLFAGDVYLGEFLVFNRGLIRADHFQFKLPPSDGQFEYELLAGVPDRLDARQRLRVPYRIVCKQDMPGPATARAASGGGAVAKRQTKDGGNDCYSYASGVTTTYDYICENGLWFPGAASSGFWYSYSRGCPGSSSGGSGGGGSIFGGAGSGGGGYTYSPGGTVIPGAPECFPCEKCKEENQCDTQCCEQETQTGGGSSGNGLCRGTSAPGPGMSGPGSSGPPPERAKSPKDNPPASGGRFTYTFVPRYHYDAHHAGWKLGDLSKVLTFKQDSQGVSAITLEEVDYAAINAARTVFQYRGNRLFKLANGWRWENKDGDWERYSTDGLLLQAGHRGLLRTELTRDAGGRVVGVNDARAHRLLTFAYTGDVLTAVEDGTGRRVDYTWQNGLITSARDALGQETQYRYDGAGRLTRMVQPGGLVINYTYVAGYLYSALDDAGNGKFFSYSYDKNRREWHSLVRTSTGLVSEKVFDSSGRVIRRTENGLTRQQTLRDNRTDLISSTTGALTQRDYDEWNNLVREVRPDGGVWTWDYHPVLHKVIRSVDPRGGITFMSYDANGNLTNRVEAFGSSIARTNSWLYDENGLLVRRVDGRGHAMDYAYDANGNVVREFDPSNPGFQTLYGYDNRGNRTAMTNALGHVTLYGYDALDRLIAETNALGYATLYTYTSNNLVQVETGRDGMRPGRTVRYRYDDHGHRTQTLRVDEQDQEHIWETTTYDADGRVIAVANALGQTTRYEYNGLGQRVKVARPLSATETSDTRFEYDDNGRLVREIDPLGVITQYDYDDLDRQRKVTEALGTPVQRSRERGYDLAGNLTSLTYSDGTNALTTLYAYDLLNRRTQIRGAREYPQAFGYDADNNLISVTNGRGYVTLHSYDPYGRRTNTVEGIGHGEPGEHAGSFAYDLLGRVVTSYDGNGNHRHYHHDALGRQTEQSIPLAPTNALPAGDWWTDNSVVLSRTWFNPWGQPVATSNIVGGVSATVYDAFGRRFTHTDAAGLTLTNTYNELDQLLAIGYPVVSSAPLGSPPTSIRYAYDPYNAHMLVSTTDRANLTTRYSYDQRFQRASELSSWGALTTYRTDQLGRQTAVTNALNEVNQSVFDQFDQLVATIYADHIPVTQERIESRAYDEFGRMTNHWGAATYDVTYDYDLAGNQVSLTDGNGNTTRWEYDGRNRKVRKIYADNSDYAYGYDANGNQTRKRDAMQRTTRYEFNAYNLLTKTDYPSDPDVTFGYDLAGRRVLMLDGTGTNTWSYDLADRVLTNAQLNVEHAVSYTYDTEGNRLSMTVTPLVGGDVWRTDYSYESAGRLENITDHGVSETPFHYAWATNGVRLASLTYPSGMKTTHDYDVLGRKTLLSTRDSADVEIAHFAYGHDKAGQRTNETTLTHTDRFEYDAKRQLVSAQRYDLGGNADPSWSYRYAYDPIGNWRTATDPAGIRHYAANALNQYTSVTNSSTGIFRYDSNGQLLTNAGDALIYDDVGHLIGISNHVDVTSFRHDGIGRRAVVADNLDSGVGVLIYDGLLVVLRQSSSAHKTYHVSRGLDASLYRDRLGGIGGLLAVSSMDAAMQLQSDVMGNIRGLTFVDNSLHETYDYTPFGSLLGAGDRLQAFQFSSKDQVSAGLLDFGRRVYSATHGRWVSRDPLGERGGPNLYCYALNAPTRWMDPYGLKCEPSFPPLAVQWLQAESPEPGDEAGVTSLAHMTGKGDCGAPCACSSGEQCPVEFCPSSDAAVRVWLNRFDGEIETCVGMQTMAGVREHENLHVNAYRSAYSGLVGALAGLPKCVKKSKCSLCSFHAQLLGAIYENEGEAASGAVDLDTYTSDPMALGGACAAHRAKVQQRLMELWKQRNELISELAEFPCE